MKIGVVTFEFNYNYGALLQAYALVSYLRNMGHTVQIFNRGWDTWTEQNKKSTLKEEISRLLGKYITLRSINAFRNRYLPLTPRIHSDEELVQTAKQFDLIIVGSDQIWSSGTVQTMGYYYFADFAIKTGIPVISYAASMGKNSFDVTSKQRANISRLLARYKAVSCREWQMIPILKGLGIEHPYCVLDPTLIADPVIYDTFTNSSGKNRIAYYFLDPNKTKYRILKQIEQALNVQSVNTYLIDTKIPLLCSKYPSVESWLSRIKNARFVVTDSFHGMVFSILFKRDFVVIANKKRGVARFTSLLGQLGLESRIVSTPEEAVILCKLPINWDIIERKLKQLKSFSLNFLITFVS